MNYCRAIIAHTSTFKITRLLVVIFYARGVSFFKEETVATFTFNQTKMALETKLSVILLQNSKLYNWHELSGISAKYFSYSAWLTQEKKNCHLLTICFKSSWQARASFTLYQEKQTNENNKTRNTSHIIEQKFLTDYQRQTMCRAGFFAFLYQFY